jgi:hypothetical protein
MNFSAVRNLSVSVLIGAGLIATSCSSGPEPPKPGTPAFYWSAAKENYAAGDYQKASEHLEKLCIAPGEYQARAQAWYLILASGMAHSYIDMADYFDYGARARAASPIAFRRQASDYRTYASRLALQFAEALDDFQKNNKDQQISLDFGYPEGSALGSPLLAKIGHGDMPDSAVVDDIRRQALKTGVLLQTCRAAGFPDDTAKTQEIFKSPKVQVARSTFLLAMANALHEQAQLFTRAKMDQPDRLKMFDMRALDTLKVLPQTKETTDLSTKIQKSLKLVSAK